MSELYVKLENVEDLIDLYQELLLCEDHHYFTLRNAVIDKIKNIKNNAEEF